MPCRVGSRPSSFDVVLRERGLADRSCWQFFLYSQAQQGFVFRLGFMFHGSQGVFVAVQLRRADFEAVL